jgi:hypothetical protein
MRPRLEDCHRMKGSRRRRRSRAALAAAPAALALGAVVVAAVAAVGARGAFRSEGAPDQAVISCTAVGPRVADPLVQPQPDGVHIAIENPAGAQQYDVHPSRWSSGSSVAGPLGRGVTRTSLAAPPGELLVSCIGDHGFSWGEPARVTVVDPARLWVSPQPSCSDVRSYDLRAGEPPAQPAPALIARSALAGLRASDVVMKPGYPQTLWTGNLVMVIRSGRPIAAITQYANQGVWLVHVKVCRGEHLLTGG